MKSSNSASSDDDAILDIRLPSSSTAYTDDADVNNNSVVAPLSLIMTTANRTLTQATCFSRPITDQDMSHSVQSGST